MLKEHFIPSRSTKWNWRRRWQVWKNIWAVGVEVYFLREIVYFHLFIPKPTILSLSVLKLARMQFTFSLIITVSSHRKSLAYLWAIISSLPTARWRMFAWLLTISLGIEYRTTQRRWMAMRNSNYIITLSFIPRNVFELARSHWIGKVWKFAFKGISNLSLAKLLCSTRHDTACCERN